MIVIVFASQKTVLCILILFVSNMGWCLFYYCSSERNQCNPLVSMVRSSIHFHCPVWKVISTNTNLTIKCHICVYSLLQNKDQNQINLYVKRWETMKKTQKKELGVRKAYSRFEDDFSLVSKPLSITLNKQQKSASEVILPSKVFCFYLPTDWMSNSICRLRHWLFLNFGEEITTSSASPF